MGAITSRRRVRTTLWDLWPTATPSVGHDLQRVRNGDTIGDTMHHGLPCSRTDADVGVRSRCTARYAPPRPFRVGRQVHSRPDADYEAAIVSQMSQPPGITSKQPLLTPSGPAGAHLHVARTASSLLPRTRMLSCGVCQLRLPTVVLLTHGRVGSRAMVRVRSPALAMGNDTIPQGPVVRPISLRSER